MVEVSIICLIYKSTKLAEMVYDSVQKYTPMLKNGKAEFFFVANDPTKNILSFLKAKKYPYIVNYNNVLSDSEMYAKGYAKPEYMRRVYRGYNYGIINAKGKRIVLINSDNFFSNDWLENLLKYSEYKNVVSSTLVEPGQEKFDIFPSAIKGNFGRTIDDYNENEFQKFANKIRKTGLSVDGAYMPCILYRDVALYAGLYPEGNLAKNSFDEVSEYGDIYFFKKLLSFGIKHYTSKDSVVYHLKEGEKSENNNDVIDSKKEETYKFDSIFDITPKDITVHLRPIINHQEIVNKLLQKVTVVIFQNENLTKLLKYLENQDFKSIEIIVVYDYLNSEIKNLKNVLLIDAKNPDNVIKYINYYSYGNFILYLDDETNYKNDFITNKLKEYDNQNSVIFYKNKNNNKINRGQYLFTRSFVNKNDTILYCNKILDLNYKYKGDYIIKAAENNNITSKNLNSRNYIKKAIKSVRQNGIVATSKKIYRKVFTK